MTARKARDTAGGSIQYGYNGRRDAHRIRYWGKDPESGVYRRMSEVVHGTRRDAQRRRAELVAIHGAEKGTLTMRQLWDTLYLPSLERRLEDGEFSPQSLKVYRSAWNKHVSPRWADAPCDSLRPLEVQQWINTLTLSSATKARNLMRSMLDMAVMYELAEKNPMHEKYVMPSKSTVKREDDGVWSHAQLIEIWEGAARDRWWEAAFLLSGFGGLRVGEALGVMGECVSDGSRLGVTLALVEVRRQVQNKGNVPVERLKTRQSKRVAVVPGPAATRLLGLADGCDWLSGDGLGSPSSQQRLNDAWAKGMEAMPEDMRHPFRNLRNSWQTMMRWEVGMDPHHIEPLMGHKVPGVTGEFYDRPTSGMLADKVAEAWLAFEGKLADRDN